MIGTAPRNCWYVAAWAEEVGDAVLLGRNILGEPVVLWRDADGRCTAMLDACPHRFAKLSMGRIEGGRLRCMYHGLLFDGAGSCVHIPGQKGGERALAAKCYPLVERQSLLWIWMGDAEQLDPALIPDCPWLDDPAWVWRGDRIHYDADYRLIVDNLLDFSHLAFVHEHTLGGGSASASLPPTVHRSNWGVRITHKQPAVTVPPVYRDLVGFVGPCDRWMNYDWFVQGNLLSLEAGFAPAGQGGLQGARPAGTIVQHPIQAVTPETRDSAHYFWSQPRNYRLDDPAVTDHLATQTLVAFEEDRLMIQAQADNISRVGAGRRMGAIRADRALGHVRDLMDRMITAENLGVRSSP